MVEKGWGKGEERSEVGEGESNKGKEEVGRRNNKPLSGNGQFPRAWAGLDDNVGLLYAAGQELCLCAGHKRLDDGCVPAGVDDGNAQGGAVVLLCGGTFERHGWFKKPRAEQGRSNQIRLD